MITVTAWVLGTINALLWGFNLAIAMSGDRTGSGMVLMLSVPLSIVISLVSLVVFETLVILQLTLWR